MIPHLIAHPSQPRLLQFIYDFDAKTTTIVPVELNAGDLVRGEPTIVDRLLRYPIAQAGHWLCATMHVREFGEPAFVERWDWDSLAEVEKLEIDYPRFGLMGMGVSDDGERAVLAGYFPVEQEDEGSSPALADDTVIVLQRSDELRACVVGLPDVGMVGALPFNAGIGSFVFNADKTRVAASLYDQDRCSVNVYELGPTGAEPIADLASEQIVTDFEQGCSVFLPGGELLVWSVQNWDFAGKVGVYAIASEDRRLDVDVDSGVEVEVEDEERFSLLIENTELMPYVAEGVAVVGTVGGIAIIDIGSGAVTQRRCDGAGAVCQVRRCGDHLVLVDHESRLFVMPAELD